METISAAIKWDVRKVRCVSQSYDPGDQNIRNFNGCGKQGSIFIPLPTGN
jgi:hypothetical protein